MLKNILFFLFVTLFMLGCEQKHFSHVYDKKEIGSKISTITIKHDENNNTINIESRLKHHNFKLAAQSPYHIQINSNIYPKRCNNPLATAEQKSYIGFVKLTLFKNQKRIYTCQSDFREKKEIKNIADGLVDILIKEMNLNSI